MFRSRRSCKPKRLRLMGLRPEIHRQQKDIRCAGPIQYEKMVKNSQTLERRNEEEKDWGKAETDEIQTWNPLWRKWRRMFGGV